MPAPAAAVAGPKTIYVNLFDEINMPKVKAIMAMCAQVVQQQKPDVLYFLFSSPGGHVTAGITLYNFLRALPVKIIMHNTGSIDSIATSIFLAGEERYAAPGTSFLFHGVGLNLPAQTRLNSTSLSELHSSLREDEKKISAIVTRHSTISAGDLRTLFKEGETKDLDFALDKRIIHEVRDVAIPRNTHLLSVNLQ